MNALQSTWVDAPACHASTPLKGEHGDTWEDWADAPEEPPGVLEDWIKELGDEKEDADGEHPLNENQS